jgi:hypothetical protein
VTNIDRRKNGDTHPDDSSGLSAAIIGRRIGMLIYWIVLIFILSAGATSIIPQVFGFRKPAGKSVIDPQKCVKQTRTLSLELRSKANDFCVRLSTHKLRGWLERWDERYRNVNANCGAPDPDRVELKALRDGLESMIANCEKNATVK